MPSDSCYWFVCVPAVLHAAAVPLWSQDSNRARHHYCMSLREQLLGSLTALKAPLNYAAPHATTGVVTAAAVLLCVRIASSQSVVGAFSYCTSAWMC
jgi:hypothetical protein